MNAEPNNQVVLDQLRELATTLVRLDGLASDPQLQAVLGQVLVQELRYPIASCRQRFPDLWPSAQQPLF